MKSSFPFKPDHSERFTASERVQILLDVNNALVTKLDRDELSAAIANSISHLIDFDKMAITIYEPENGNFRVAALEGRLPLPGFERGMVLESNNSFTGVVFASPCAIMRRDLTGDAQFDIERLLCNAGLRSICAIPLRVGDRGVGTFGVASTRVDAFTEADAELLTDIGKQIALAVANAEAYRNIRLLQAGAEHEAQRRRVLLEVNNAIIGSLEMEELIHRVGLAVRSVVPYDLLGLSLYDQNMNALRIVALEGDFRSKVVAPGSIMPTGNSLSWRVFSSQEAVIRSDIAREGQYETERRFREEGVRSSCNVPLIVHGRSIGVLGLISQSLGQYRPEDLGLIQEVANQIALAVANAQAYGEIAALKSRLQSENAYLQEEIHNEHNFEEVIGNSRPLLELLDRVQQVASTDSAVLVLGETGTGKELIARALHDRSRRKPRPLVKVNCGAMTEGLVESELFGHVKGAYTGALSDREGRFKVADGGTLFLDEVGELPLSTQVKLLRVLQEQEFEPLGSNRTARVDVRIVAATNRDLEALVQQGKFRADLFFRLNVFLLHMPSLRQRRDDIPLLATYFVERTARKIGRKLDGISQGTMQQLLDYHWPGNVRELQNVIERAVILSRGRLLELDQPLVPECTAVTAPAMPASQNSAQSMAAVSRQHILEVLEQTGWLIEGPRGAARVLDLHPNTLRARMKKLGIVRPKRS
jgi:formate hydrogenlyase transcriptional activator